MYKDFLGNELHIGDKVIYVSTKYKELKHGIILKLNEQQSTIRNFEYGESHYGYNMMGIGKISVYYNNIIKE